jgi:N-acetylglucosamine kinase-like BadF-type ATPase
MILIADSGSTKCDWLLMETNGEVRGTFSTMGFNPYFHSSQFVHEQMMLNTDIMAIASQVNHVFFYGAGASTPALCHQMEDGLTRVFTAAKVIIDHDLVGAAYAVYDGAPCIAAILGTGSNSCFFDGKEISEEVPALAYILGDEASGSWFGKQLLRNYFYKTLPLDIRADFDDTYSLTKDELVKNVYNNPHANVWLASFMPFISKHKAHPTIQEWMTDGLREFVKIHVKCYPQSNVVPTHFVGSVAYYFEPILRKVCAEEGVICGKIVKKPIHNLADYHLKYLIPQLQRS